MVCAVCLTFFFLLALALPLECFSPRYTHSRVSYEFSFPCDFLLIVEWKPVSGSS